MMRFKRTALIFSLDLSTGWRQMLRGRRCCHLLSARSRTLACLWAQTHVYKVPSSYCNKNCTLGSPGRAHSWVNNGLHLFEDPRAPSLLHDEPVSFKTDALDRCVHWRQLNESIKPAWVRLSRIRPSIDNKQILNTF